MSLKQFIRGYSLSPRWRYVQHIEYLKEHITITTKKDKENFSSLYHNFLQTNNKLGFYTKIRIVVSLLLYISLFSSILGGLVPFFKTVAEPIIVISSAIGASVLTLIFLALNRIINVITADLIIEHAHLLSILIKNNKDFIVQPHYGLLLFKKYS